MAKLISKTYGEALFELAVEENKVDVFADEIRAILDILNQNPDFVNLLNHPKISKEEKLQVVDEVFGGKVSKEIQGFLNIIVSKERNKEIMAMISLLRSFATIMFKNPWISFETFPPKTSSTT